MRKTKKRKVLPIVTENLDQFLSRGGSIELIPTQEPVKRLLFSSGHFNAKRSNQGQSKKSGEVNN